jgi:hypothetical protein
LQIGLNKKNRTKCVIKKWKIVGGVTKIVKREHCGCGKEFIGVGQTVVGSKKDNVHVGWEKQKFGKMHDKKLDYHGAQLQ